MAHKKLTVKEIELDKLMKSAIKRGWLVKIKGGYKVTPLGVSLFGQEGKSNGKSNKKGGKIKRK